MKTFLEFISEAKLIENDQQEFAQLRAKIKMLQSRGRPGDAEEIRRLTQRVSELQMGTQAKIGAQLNKDKPQEPTNSNTKVRGYASKPRDVVSRAGTTSGVQRSDLPTEQGMNISGRYSDTRSRSQRGGSVPARNRGQGRSTPERSHHSEG